jgi:hypothetical protein
MKSKVPAKTPQSAAKRPSAEIQGRINAAWLRFWKAVYPNTPPPRIARGPKSEVQSPHAEKLKVESRKQRWGGRNQGAEGRNPKSEVRGPRSKVQCPAAGRPAAVDYLSSFLCAGFAVVLLATGCAGPRPLKGGHAVTTRKPAGVVEQTLVQGQNAAEGARQDQESVRVRTYTLPAGTRMEESRVQAAPSGVPLTNVQAVVLSTPMPVVEREETRARTELGAAQEDTARELGARLSSLKGIVWVGAGLFVFGLASLVWPPLKVIIASVTTSAALMLGGLALMVLPSLVVGNELRILGGVAVAVGGWFLAHRHGHLRGMVAASTGAQSDALRSGAVAASGGAPGSQEAGASRRGVRLPGA